MGGSNSSTAGGLRFHVNDTEHKVHIHDDSNNTKFTLDTKEFKKEITSALKGLQKGSGLTSIAGDNRTRLYIMNDDGTYHAFISEGTSMKKDIEDFLKGL